MLIDTADTALLATLQPAEREFLLTVAARLEDARRVRSLRAIEAHASANGRASLRDLRKARGLTCKALGALAGVGASCIHRYELGRRRPEPGPLAALAKALGVPVGAIDLVAYVPTRRTAVGSI